jgi:hypothetical protein
MSSHLRIASALAAPLLLGACGLPVGVQIASLFADGISYLTTDKTLTDHGISAVANKDCALWRGVEGKPICDDAQEPDSIKTALAEAAPEVFVETAFDDSDSALPPEMIKPIQPVPVMMAKNNPAFPRDNKTIITARVAPALSGNTANTEQLDVDRMILGDASDDISASETAVEPITTAITSEPVTPRKQDAPSQAEFIIAENSAPPLPHETTAKTPTKTVSLQAKIIPAKSVTPTPIIKAKGATYYIIASYHRPADAQRFSGHHAKLKPAILEGRAKGTRVFRVAIGPVSKTERRPTRARLKKAGFKDTWKLTLKAPKVLTELASLN